MANYYGYARSNYVRIIDEEGLVKSLEGLSVKVYLSQDNPELSCLLCDNESGWMTARYDEESGEETEFSFEKDVMPFIAEGEVLIVQEIGNEKLRYLVGQSVAFVRKGDTVQSIGIGMDNIYELASKEFEIPADQITQATY